MVVRNLGRLKYDLVEVLPFNSTGSLPSLVVTFMLVILIEEYSHTAHTTPDCKVYNNKYWRREKHSRSSVGKSFD